jgi:hypothetical protein
VTGFRNNYAITEARDAGRIYPNSIRKVPSQASVAGWWVDLSMASGNPSPNYYLGAQLEATTLNKWKGIAHGDDKAPQSKHLASLTLMTPTAGLVGTYHLLDYLAFYPAIELDNADPQVMINAGDLPRYEDGEGVMAMVVAMTPTVGFGTFEFDYVNQDGVTRTSEVHQLSTSAANIASIVTSQPATVAGFGGPWLRLRGGDTGIRRIVEWRQLTLDGGLVAVVLVKPVATHTIIEINTPHALEFPQHITDMPRILDGAYLGLIMNCAATVAAGILAGSARFIWSE